jgi:hypothetical protein
MMSYYDMKSQQQRLYNIAFVDSFEQYKESDESNPVLQNGFEIGYSTTFDIGLRIGSLLGSVTTDYQLEETQQQHSKSITNNRINKITTTPRHTSLPVDEGNAEKTTAIGPRSTMDRDKERIEEANEEGTENTKERVQHASKLIRHFFESGFPSSSSSSALSSSLFTAPKAPTGSSSVGVNNQTLKAMDQVSSNLSVLEEQINTILTKVLK